MNDPTPISPRRRLQMLLAIPDSQRTEAEWDEIIELEISTAPGNRLDQPARYNAPPGQPRNPGAPSGQKGKPRRGAKGGPGGSGGNSGGNSGGGGGGSGSGGGKPHGQRRGRGKPAPPKGNPA